MATDFCNHNCRAFTLCSQPCVNGRFRKWDRPIGCEKPTSHY